MRHTWVLLVAAVAATAALAPKAIAQQSLDGRIGPFFAVDSVMRGLDKTWIAAGIDAHIGTKFVKDSDTVLSLDILTRDLGHSRSNVFPITLSEYFYFPYGIQRSYLGLGFAVYVADVGTSSKTVLGARLTAGLELTQDWFVEADYYLSEKFSGDTDARVNGLALYLGFRF